MVQVQTIKELLDSSVIIIDKPPKLSSHEITSLVKKIIGAKKTGHAGTLDPNVSGVLPIALGRATKLLDYIVAKDKTYVCIIKFKTEQSIEKVLSLFKKFEGKIIQIPPKISAVRKIPRKRFIHYIKFLEQNGKFVLFETKTQAGTYIRTLCDDLGKLVEGARMEELRRIAVGDILEKKAIKMQDFSDAVWLWKSKNDENALRNILLPVEEYLKNYKKIFVKNSTVVSLLNGVQLAIPGISKFENFAKGETIAIYSKENKFIGMGTSLFSCDEIKKMNNGIVVKTERIHLQNLKNSDLIYI